MRRSLTRSCTHTAGTQARKPRGREPTKPVSGKLMLRTPPEVHGAALVAAQANGISLNQWAGRVLAEAARANLAGGAEA